MTWRIQRMSTKYLDQVQTPVDDIYIALKLLATTLGDDASDRRVKVRASLLYIEISIPRGRDHALVYTFLSPIRLEKNS